MKVNTPLQVEGRVEGSHGGANNSSALFCSKFGLLPKQKQAEDAGPCSSTSRPRCQGFIALHFVECSARLLCLHRVELGGKWGPLGHTGSEQAGDGGDVPRGTERERGRFGSIRRVTRP